MRMLALLVLGACSPTDTTLSNGGKDNDTVVGTGKMQIDRESVEITDIQVGYSKSESFTITSIGDGNLQLYELRIVADASDVFYFDEVEDVELAPEQSASYTVVADLDEAAAADGELRIRTSDPDAAAYILPLHAYPEGWVPSDTGADTGADSGM